MTRDAVKPICPNHPHSAVIPVQGDGSVLGRWMCLVGACRLDAPPLMARRDGLQFDPLDEIEEP